MAALKASSFKTAISQPEVDDASTARTSAAARGFPKFVPLLAFGFTGHKDGLMYINDNTVVYPVGRMLACYSHKDGGPSPRFSDCLPSVSGILSMCVSPNGKLVAVCEKTTSGAPQMSVLAVHKLARTRTYNCPAPAQADLVTCAISHDMKYLCACSAEGSDSRLYVWRFDSSKTLSFVALGAAATKCSYNPDDSSECLTSGRTHVKLWKLENARTWKCTLVPGVCDQKSSTHEATDHAWLGNGRFAVTTTAGVIFVVTNGALGQKLQHSAPTFCVAPLLNSGGFFIGADKGMLSYYSFDQGTYSMCQEFNAVHEQAAHLESAQAPIVCVAVPPGEQSAAVVLAETAVLSISLAGLDSTDWTEKYRGGTARLKFDSIIPHFHCRAAAKSRDEAGPKPEEVWALGQPPWAGSHPPEKLASEGSILSQASASAGLPKEPPPRINAMDVCERRNKVVTAGVDRTVRVWDWVDARAEFIHECPYEPAAVAIDHYGYQVVVSYKHTVAVYDIMMDALNHTQDIAVKGCDLLVFSPSNEYLALNQGRDIFLYETRKWTVSQVMKGHSRNVTAFAWTQDNTMLVSTGAEGAVYTWKVADGFKLEENVAKGSDYRAIMSMHAHTSVIVADAAFGLKALDTVFSEAPEQDSPNATLTMSRQSESAAAAVPGGQSTYLMNILAALDMHRPSPTCFCHLPSKAVLILGMDNGSVRIVPEIHENSRSGDFYEMHVFSSPVRQVLALGPSSVYAMSRDGEVLVLGVADALEEREAVYASLFDSASIGIARRLVLVDQVEQQERTAEVADMRYMMEKAEQDVAFRIKMKDEQLASKMKESKEELDAQAFTMNEKAHRMEASYQKQIQALKRLLETQQSQANQREDEMTEKAENKLAREIERTDGAEKEVERLKRRFGRQMAEYREQQRAEMARMQAEVDVEKEKARASVAQMEQAFQKKVEFMKSYISWEQETYDVELDEVMMTGNEEYSMMQKKMQEIKGQVSYMKNVNGRMNHQIKNVQEQHADSLKQLKQLDREKQELADTVESLRAELDRKEELFVDKDREMYALQARNRDLDTWKKVQTAKVESLRAESEPIKEEYEELCKKMKQLEDAATGYMEREHAARMEVTQWKEKCSGLKSEAASLRSQLGDSGRHLKLFVSDLSKLTQMKEPKQWQKGIQEIYDRLEKSVGAARKATGAGSAISEEDRIGYSVEVEELNLQRTALENFMGSLKKLVVRKEDTADRQKTKMLNENMKLLTEMNQIKRDNQDLRLHLSRMRAESVRAANASSSAALQPSAPTPYRALASPSIPSIPSAIYTSQAHASRALEAEASGPPGFRPPRPVSGPAARLESDLSASDLHPPPLARPGTADPYQSRDAAHLRSGSAGPARSSTPSQMRSRAQSGRTLGGRGYGAGQGGPAFGAFQAGVQSRASSGRALSGRGSSRSGEAIADADWVKASGYDYAMQDKLAKNLKRIEAQRQGIDRLKSDAEEDAQQAEIARLRATISHLLGEDSTLQAEGEPPTVEYITDVARPAPGLHPREAYTTSKPPPAATAPSPTKPKTPAGPVATNFVEGKQAAKRQEATSAPSEAPVKPKGGGMSSEQFLDKQVTMLSKELRDQQQIWKSDSSLNIPVEAAAQP